MHLTNSNLDCGIIEITLHNTCNFKCKYCSPYSNDGTYQYREDITPYLKIINDFKQRNKYVLISLLGGEPTLMPGFNDLLEKVVSDNTLVTFNTNASRTLRYWEEFRPGPYLMGMSWHSEEVDDEHYLKVAEIMSSKCEVDAELLVLPDQFERAKEMHRRLSKLKVSVSPKIVKLNLLASDYFSYTPEQAKWIGSSKITSHTPNFFKWRMPSKMSMDGVPVNWVNMQVKGQHNFYGWTCMAGIRRLQVNPDGTVTGCAAGANKPFGNIFTSYELPDEPMRCNLTACNCFYDAVIEKWSN